MFEIGNCMCGETMDRWATLHLVEKPQFGVPPSIELYQCSNFSECGRLAMVNWTSDDFASVTMFALEGGPEMGPARRFPRALDE